MTIARLAMVAVAVVALAFAIRAVPAAAAGRRRFRWRPTRHQPSRLPADLAALERMVWMATSSAADRHHRLAPLARGIARHRLAAHRGVDLDREPEQAARLLGATAWELVRPDRQPPTDRFARGVPVAELRELVTALDELKRR